jgi:hypothetical protein
MKGCKKRKVKISANCLKCLFAVWAYLISISTHFTPSRAEETVGVTCHNDIRFGVSPCNSAHTVKILMRFVLNQFIDGLFTYVVSKSCNGRIINNWWMAKDMVGKVPEFAWWSFAVAQISFSAKPRQSSRNLTTHLHHAPVAYRGVCVFQTPPPKFWQSWAEFPVPWKIHPLLFSVPVPSS